MVVYTIKERIHTVNGLPLNSPGHCLYFCKKTLARWRTRGTSTTTRSQTRLTTTVSTTTNETGARIPDPPRPAIEAGTTPAWMISRTTTMTSPVEAGTKTLRMRGTTTTRAPATGPQEPVRASTPPSERRRPTRRRRRTQLIPPSRPPRLPRHRRSGSWPSSPRRPKAATRRKGAETERPTRVDGTTAATVSISTRCRPTTMAMGRRKIRRGG